MVAVETQDIGLIKKLLENTLADINLQDWQGKTALMIGAFRRDLDIVKVLVEDYGADTAIRDHDRRTALDWAELTGWTDDEALRLLSPKRARSILGFNLVDAFPASAEGGAISYLRWDL